MSDLARMVPAPEQPEFDSIEDTRRIFDICRVMLLGVKDTPKAAENAVFALEKEMRHVVETAVETINDTNLSPNRQEVISEYLFRQLGDLSSAIDNLRRITHDIRHTDIEGILARHEGR